MIALANKRQILIDDNIVVINDELNVKVINEEVVTKDIDLISLVQKMITQQRITNKILSESFDAPLYKEEDLTL